MIRKLNFTIAIDDTDEAENAVRNWFDANFEVITSKALPNTEEFKDQTQFKKLIKAKKQAQKNIDYYIDRQRGINHKTN